MMLLFRAVKKSKGGWGGKWERDSKGRYFLLFMISFAVRKLICLIRSHLFIFGFIFTVLGDRSKKILLQFMSKNDLPVSLQEFCSIWLYV